MAALHSMTGFGAARVERDGCLARVEIRSVNHRALKLGVKAFPPLGAFERNLRDRVSGRLVAYVIGSPLENHDELGVRDDPGYGDNHTIYLQAMAVAPQLKNQAEVEGLALDAFRARAEWLGYAWLSTLIEARYVETGPAWMKAATVVETVENYMHSGVPFVYLRSSLVAPPAEG